MSLKYSSSGGSLYDTRPAVEDLLTIMKNEVTSRRNKNVEILQLGADIVRRMQGRFPGFFHLRWIVCRT